MTCIPNSDRYHMFLCIYRPKMCPHKTLEDIDGLKHQNKRRLPKDVNDLLKSYVFPPFYPKHIAL